MNMPKYKSTKQQGFTLLESLVALAIFSIVVLGSGLVMSRMLHVQKNMYVDDIIINEMQNRLQNSMISSGAQQACQSAALKQNIQIDGQSYYVGCATEEIRVSESAVVEWPVLAVSHNAAHAQACATGIQHRSCYVVGR